MEIELKRPYTRGENWYMVISEADEEYFVRIFHQNHFIAGKWIKKDKFIQEYLGVKDDS